VETVSSIALVDKDAENILAQIDAPDMIAALLEAFEGNSIQTRNGEGWVYGSLTMQHKNFSFLQCETRYCYSPEQEISYCQKRRRGGAGNRGQFCLELTYFLWQGFPAISQVVQ